MSPIFGNGNTYSKSGNNTFINGKNGSSTLTNTGKHTFDSNGQNMTHSGNMSFTSSGKTITQSGNQFFVGGKTYTKSGNILFDSNGKSWSGNMTDNDVKNIIFKDNN